MSARCATSRLLSPLQNSSQHQRELPVVSWGHNQTRCNLRLALFCFGLASSPNGFAYIESKASLMITFTSVYQDQSEACEQLAGDSSAHSHRYPMLLLFFRLQHVQNHELVDVLHTWASFASGLHCRVHTAVALSGVLPRNRPKESSNQGGQEIRVANRLFRPRWKRPRGLFPRLVPVARLIECLVQDASCCVVTVV